jgi:hypothetical protein
MYNDPNLDPLTQGAILVAFAFLSVLASLFWFVISIFRKPKAPSTPPTAKDEEACLANLKRMAETGSLKVEDR